MPDAAPLSALRAPAAWIVFFAVAAGVLAFDLGLKGWSFANVGHLPVKLIGDPNDAVDLWPQYGRTHLIVYAADPDDPRYNAGALYTLDAVPIARPLLDLRLTTNTGAVFGLGSGNRWFFISVSVLAVGVIGYLFVRSPARAHVQHVGLALILAGALGNLYDRVRYGAVRDMLHMLPGVDLPFGLHWPGAGGRPGSPEVWPWIFNPADVALLAGVGLIFLITLRGPKPQSPPAR